MTMNQESWTKPVLLERFGAPGPLQFTTIESAARLLLQIPAERRSVAQVEALRTFRDALMFKASPALARANFIGAVLEAGYYVLPETFLDQPAVQQAPPRPTSADPDTDVKGKAIRMMPFFKTLRQVKRELPQTAYAPVIPGGRALQRFAYNIYVAVRTRRDEPVGVWM
jgi:hypothetical protein